jgi:hypothetical protein
MTFRNTQTPDVNTARVSSIRSNAALHVPTSFQIAPTALHVLADAPNSGRHPQVRFSTSSHDLLIEMGPEFHPTTSNEQTNSQLQVVLTPRHSADASTCLTSRSNAATQHGRLDLPGKQTNQHDISNHISTKGGTVGFGNGEESTS